MIFATTFFRQRTPFVSFAQAIAASAVLALSSGCATMAKEDSNAASSERYQKVVASPLRTAQDRQMDASRHPLEFLPFTGARPGMRVLDVAAGAGYTSQLLALAVAPDGTVWAQREQAGAALTKRLADQPQANFIPLYRPFDDPVPSDAPKLDLITIVLNYHDITYLPVDRAKMNERWFAALRPGGHLVVIDHSGRPGTGISEGKTLHRIDEAVVIAEATKAGFVLEAEGKFLRNPADARDQPSAPTQIPTDKFALRFVKP